MERKDYDSHPEVYRTEKKQRKETEVKFLKTQQIRASNDELCSIQDLCRLAGISRASYYKWIHRKPSRVDIEDTKILPRIQAITDENYTTRNKG
jgi:hypothetical protein